MISEIDFMTNQNEKLRKHGNELREVDLLRGASEKSEDEILKILQQQLDSAQKQIADLSQISDEKTKREVPLCNEPSADHEKLRRRVDNGVNEIWYYIKSKLNEIKQMSVKDQIDKHIDDILVDGGDRQRLNPRDCRTSKKLVCNINKQCGYGCRLHHLVYCLIMAYGSERTLILEYKGTGYSKDGWEKLFKPLSNKCTDTTGTSRKSWTEETRIKEVQVVDLPMVDLLQSKPNYLPLAIPEDLSKRLLLLHGQPAVWWIAQFLKYITRPQPFLQSFLNETKNKVNFERPIVGVHVRRTDKIGTEAAFHKIDEYMVHVEEYYKRLSRIRDVPIKRVYLATDEPHLLSEAQQKFPDYVFVSDNDISKSASLHQRSSEESLKGVIADIHFLSESDYLVCTFSSQVCRVAYELMQTRFPDASTFFHSLDDVYYFGGQNAHDQTVLYRHVPRNEDEIPLELGDLVGIAGDLWDGYSKGLNRRIHKTGLYPSYKTEDKPNIAKMTTYPEAEKDDL
uniref:Alpha-(1,6)-fucosyltransferase-like n=1 Tax=Saccoglossus kowalevskii TaxID=10224 RepID=A0ABM0MEN3_SACKO|nr:PREDICTED: alpha-(1,6)-fucosyltransferase-like [Saccoglossus kowalevskii]